MGPFRATTHRVWQIGDWTLDEGCHRLIRGGEVRSLNPKELSVLRHLAEAAPDLVSSDDLFDSTWPDVVVGDHVLHEVISRLRRALGDKAQRPRYIETLHRRGYRLLVQVEPAGADADDPASAAGRAEPSAPLNRHALVNASLTLLMCLIAAGAWWWYLQERPSAVGNRAPAQIGLAVLPFVNLSGDPEMDYFGDAIASEIVTRLRPSEALRVISMTSARVFKDTSLDVREIGARLTADYIIEGELTGSGPQVRANLRLIETSGGTNVWSDRLSLTLTDLNGVFALYDRVSSNAAKSISLHLGRPALVSTWRLQAAPSGVDAAAYHLLLRASFRFEESGDPREALKLVDQALQRAPQWAKAISVKAAFLTKQAEYGMIPGEQGFSAARRWARQAIEIDPSLGDAHATLGYLDAAIDLDFPAAMERLEEAERRGASIEILWPFKEYVLLNAGRFEDALDINRRFDSISPANAFVKGSIGRLLWRLDRNSEARTSLDEALELAPKNVWVCTEALRYYVHRAHDEDRATAVINQCFDGSDQMSSNLGAYWRANLAHALGDPSALAALADRAEQRSRTRHVDSRVVALMYYRLGRYDKHIEWTRTRVQAKQQLIELPDELRMRPDYWTNLREWAVADPDETEARLALVDQHRNRIRPLIRETVLRH